MNDDVKSPRPEDVLARARRAYEGGMLRLGLARAGIVTTAVGALAALGIAQLPSPLWFVPIFAAWLFMGWRGGVMWAGARGGLVAGLAALALPLSILRPCCQAMTSATSCARPELSMGAGAVLGFVVAVTLPRLRSTSEWARAGFGAFVAVGSLVACRCASLFLGESIGLLGGLLASAAGVVFARAWWNGRSTT